MRVLHHAEADTAARRATHDAALLVAKVLRRGVGVGVGVRKLRDAVEAVEAVMLVQGRQGRRAPEPEQERLRAGRGRAGGAGGASAGAQGVTQPRSAAPSPGRDALALALTTPALVHSLTRLTH